jgi:putative Mn2+ efflux pump MntP
MDVLFLAFALSMDAFAVSLGLGAKKLSNLFVMALKCGLYFGIFQALMPLIGYFIGRNLLHYVEYFDHWIAFGLLVIIGLKMIFESLQNDATNEIKSITHQALLVLAIATSIDAMAAGFTLNLLSLRPFLSVFIIGVVTSLFSFSGIYIGNRTGTYLEKRAEIIGGITLILIGSKILIEHLFFSKNNDCLIVPI